MSDPGQDPQVLVAQAVETLRQNANVIDAKLQGIFSMAGDEVVAQVVALTAERAYAIPVVSAAVEPIRRHRMLTVGSDGPWLRLLFESDDSGDLRIRLDYGAAEIPAEQLLSADAYRRDIDRHPRQNIPLWLLAYVSNTGQQLRSAADARAGSTTAVDVLVADNDLPPLPLLWARMAAYAAVCRGSGVSVGSRTDPSFQQYIGDAGGCILARLPSDRAILSGGRDDSWLLTAAYRGSIAWPDLYRGAPEWLHNLYLDPRAAAGRLSFCYWWEDGHWYRAELPDAAVPLGGDHSWSRADEVAGGVPAVWTRADAAELIAKTLAGIGFEPTGDRTGTALGLVEAAEAQTASEQHLAELFAGGVPQAFDMAEAISQLDAADVLMRAWLRP
ncbi:MAG: hypothetical protein ACRDTI_09375 [Mycobacterium sp.]